ncbi:hypothetical protein F4X88_19015 [Candidatus Poribacteria bacterium]|nr:hypothetical protein [Candidatus Poribacteria bacterium]MYA58380.1 hypothetical protein [Candidatus Poribacteria bacterium]
MFTIFSTLPYHNNLWDTHNDDNDTHQPRDLFLNTVHPSTQGCHILFYRRYFIVHRLDFGFYRLDFGFYRLDFGFYRRSFIFYFFFDNRANLLKVLNR